MKLLISLLVLIIFGAIAYQLYGLRQKASALQEEFSVVEKKAKALLSENVNLEADIKYYGEDRNLEKEVRSQLNYARAGEKLIIVVPKKQ